MPHDHDHDHHDHEHHDWKHDGVRVIPGNSLDANTAQTPGMDRKAAINFARVGAQKIWAGTVSIHSNAKTGAHHHGPLESVGVEVDRSGQQRPHPRARRCRATRHGRDASIDADRHRDVAHPAVANERLFGPDSIHGSPH